ncbi:MAG: Cna B-type domain-containing protein [Clostridia bacterium]|nr:Cna B-type domain-containing protein [Clostridia bacterium]
MKNQVGYLNIIRRMGVLLAAVLLLCGLFGAARAAEPPYNIPVHVTTTGMDVSNFHFSFITELYRNGVLYQSIDNPKLRAEKDPVTGQFTKVIMRNGTTNKDYEFDLVVRDYAAYWKCTVSYDKVGVQWFVHFDRLDEGPLTLTVAFDDFDNALNTRPDTIAPRLAAKNGNSSTAKQLYLSEPADTIVQNGDGTYTVTWNNIRFKQPISSSENSCWNWINVYWDLQLGDVDYVASVPVNYGSNFKSVLYSGNKVTVPLLMDETTFVANVNINNNYLELNPNILSVYEQMPQNVVLELVDPDGNPVEGSQREVALTEYRTTGSRDNRLIIWKGSTMWDMDESLEGYTVRLAETSDIPAFYRETINAPTLLNGSYNQNLQYTAQTVSRSFRVVFDDQNNLYKTRPSSAYFIATFSDGYTLSRHCTSSTSYTFDVPGWRKGQYSFPKYDVNGDLITYELSMKYLPKAYELIVSGSTLTARLMTRTITADVEWILERDGGKNRPQDVVICLKDVSGNVLASQAVSAATDWKVSFEVPVYDSEGNIAQYTLEQNDLQFHTTEVTKTVEDGNAPATEAGKPETTIDDIEHYLFTNAEQEEWNYSIDLVWDTTKVEERYERYEISATNNNTRTLTYRLTINVNAAKYEKGDLEVRLPYRMGNYGNSNGTVGSISPVAGGIAVPMAPEYNINNAFNYYIDDHGTDDKLDDELVFVNWRDIEDSLAQTIEVQYQVKPYKMLDTVPQVWQATGYGIKYEVIGGEKVKTETEVLKSPVISYGIDTGCSLKEPTLHNIQALSVPEGRYLTSENPDDYVYMKFQINDVLAGYSDGDSVFYNQYGTFRIDVEVPEGVELSRDYGIKFENDEHTKGYFITDFAPTDSKWDENPSDGMERLCNVRIPKTLLNEDGTYSFRVKVTHTAIVEQPHTDDKVTGVDFNDVHTRPKTFTLKYKPPVAWTYTGDIYSAKKTGGTIQSVPVTRLELGMEPVIQTYSLQSLFFGYNLNPYQIDIRDDALYAVGTVNGEVQTPVRLQAGDYELTLTGCTVNWHSKDFDGNTIYTNKPRGEFVLQGQTEVNGEWKEISRFQLTSSSGTGGFRPDEALFKDQGYTSLRVLSPQGLEDYVGIYLSIKARLFPDGPYFSQNVTPDLEHIRIHNWSAHKFYVLSDETGEYEWFNSYDYGYLPPGGIYHEAPADRDYLADYTDLFPEDFAREGAYMLRDMSYTGGGRIENTSSTSKTIIETVNNVVDGCVDAHFRLYANERMTGITSDLLDHETMAAYAADMSWTHGIYYDLLPAGYTFDDKKEVNVYGASGTVPASLVRVETEDNFRGSGRQMVRFYLQYDGEPGENLYINDGIRTAFTVEFWAKATWQDLSLFPAGYNVVCFQEGSEDASGNIIYGGANNLIPDSRFDNGGLFTYYHGTNVKETMTDLNNDGITTGICDTLAASVYINPDFVSAYQVGLEKLVKGNSGVWQKHDVADLGGEYRYKIRFTTGSNGTTKELILFDILEEAVNTEAAMHEVCWKGKFRGVDVTVPTLQGIAPKVYYSTVPDLDYNKFTSKADLADATIWSLTPPQDLDTVTAVAFDLSTGNNGSAFSFTKSQTTEVEIIMEAPELLPREELAYNRSSYSCKLRASSSAQDTLDHHIGHRVTVALYDEKDFEFIKMGELEDADPAILSGVEFTLFKCEHTHVYGCTSSCHIHSGVPGEEGSCWTDVVGSRISGSDGKVLFEGLSNGIYALVETGTRNGFAPTDDMYWTFEVDASTVGGITDPVSAGTADPHVSFAGNADDGFTLLNTRVMTSIDVEKKWVGEDATTSVRPDSILLDLYRNEELYREGVNVTPDADGYWKYTFEDLYVADFEGNPYTYEVRERPVPGYVSTVNEEDGKVTVTNTCLGQLEISKLVVDGDETKPFSFTVYFTGEGTPLEGDYTVRRTAADGAVTDETVTAAVDGSLTVTAAHGESVRLLGLPIGAGYIVTETAASGYSAAVTAGSAAGTIQTGTVHQVTFTNTYDASGSWTPGASKTVNGEPAGDDESFTFTLTSGADTPAVSQEKTNNGGSIAFDPIEYGLADAGQTYTYTVQETGVDGNGYTLDDTVYTVTVKITDNGDGSLTATPSYKADGETADAIVFSNVYEATGQWTPEATKTVNGVEPRADQTFSFQLLGAGDTVIETVENNGGSIAFSTLSYDLEDLPSSPFTYRVQECEVTEAGYTGDDTVYTAFVWLEDNRDGTLKVTTLLKADGETAEAIAFANTYEATGELTLTAVKTVNGAAPREDQVYSFTLTSGEGTPELAQEKNNLLGDITFDPIRYTYADAGRTYTYYLQESTESEGDLVTDPTVYTITVEIADNGDGTLSVTKSITGGEGEAVETAAFNNTLYAPLTIRKTVTGPDTEETFPITVRLYDAQGTELTETFSYTGDLSGQLTSGDTILLGQNQSITITDLLPGMQYTVEENPGVRYTATVGGTESNIISGVCAEGGTEAAFDNVLKTTGISVTKEWQGGIGGDIQLVLYANGIKVEPQPVYHQDGQTYSYINLPMYDLQGQTITYSVKEKYMDGYLTIYQNIAPHTGESECVYNGGTIINREVITFRIRKEWNGLGDMAKPPITLTLYCNGTVYDREQPQPDEDGWYVYRNLPKYVKGERAVYTIEEQAMSGFETYYYAIDGSRIQIGQNGGRIVNVWLPSTGDRQPLGLWIGLGVLALAGLAGLLVWKRKR